MNLCAHCQETFRDWVLYQEHLLDHNKIAVSHSLAYVTELVDSEPKELNVFSSGRTDLKKRDYPGPMNETEKRLIVARGERRLGLQHFIGVALLLLVLWPIHPAFADDDKKDDGNPGPQGIQGVQGVPGVNGTNASGTTQMGVEGVVRILDTKHFQVQMFDTYSFDHNLFFGSRVMLKIGKSYEEELIEKLQMQIKELNRIKQ